MTLQRLSVLGMMGLLIGCATTPTGPSVLVLPGAHQDFGTFNRDDGFCRQHALAQIGGTTPSTSAAETGVGAAAVGTAVGAASGAAFGGGYGAAVGAGAGLIGGSMVGTGMGYQAGYALQQRYDHAYIQCMYGHGHQVPVQGVIARPVPSATGAPQGTSKPPGMSLPPTSSGIPLPPAQVTPGSASGSSGQNGLPLPPH
jgi:hypothetical protein